MAKRNTKGPVTSTTSKGSQSSDPPPGVLPEHWTFYQPGRSVVERMSDRGEKREPAIREVEKETGVPYGRVKKASLFYERYSVEQLKRLGRIKSKTGEPLTASHLMHLAQFEAKEDQEEWISRLERKFLTATDLREAISQRADKPQEDKGAGRPLKEPEDLVERLRAVLSQTSEWLKHHDAHWAEESDWLAATDSVDPEASRLLDKVVAELDRLGRTARALEKRISKNADRIKRSTAGEGGRNQGRPKKIPTGGRSERR